MNRKNTNSWIDEERKRVADVFVWLLKEDKKQNPDLYRKVPLEKGQSESEMNS